MDLMGLWIDGKYDELFATLRDMPLPVRARNIVEMCATMKEFDETNSDEEIATCELQSFLDECNERL